jgi:hydroxypyruvate isomerase
VSNEDRQSNSNHLSRRNFVAATAAASAFGIAAAQTTNAQETDEKGKTTLKNAKEGRLSQSVCKWCFPKISLDAMSAAVAEMGLVGIDLLNPGEEFETVKKHGLVCTMVSSHSLQNGLCDPKFHDECLEKLEVAIEATSAEGWRNVISFSGNARGIDRKTGMKNCVEALKKITPLAEKKNVIINMELLNSRVDHADYMCDKSEWGIELVKQVGSDNFKLLYDIYHMQIMEGDLIRSIQDNHQYFGHYHTAGNPGRNEFDETQELYYPPIAKAIAELDFDGYIAHEFIPTRDPLTSLREAVDMCTV